MKVIFACLEVAPCPSAVSQSQSADEHNFTVS